jgi:hypothetical protein
MIEGRRQEDDPFSWIAFWIGGTCMFASALAYVLPSREYFVAPFATAGLIVLCLGLCLRFMALWRR